MIPSQIDSEVLDLPYGDCRIRCHVRRSSLRKNASVAIHVEPNGVVYVDAPPWATSAEVRKAVSIRIRWIQKRVQEIEHSKRLVLPREYVSGEAVYYFGRRYRLKVLASKEAPAVRLRGSFLYVGIGNRNPEQVRTALEAWYLARARRAFQTRLVDMCRRLPWTKQVPPTTLRQMKARWGSCSATGRLTLNPNLVRAPRECIDYVILHELCHLKVHDHSPRFHKLLDSYLPEWKRVKIRLDGLAEAILAS